ncbi:disease resistance protein RUN1-like [Eucalyptus grandis]|uniref:disease resistance protein RUN1-like n=1 Tax=Eucalyptus grandis TaxID=71139 RepID=UPI00192EA13B|nr:disease resistance protein RUN1-like [Eucalyptus grandis]
MQHPIFSHYFALLVALILLFMVAFNFLLRKKFSICRNAKGVGIGKSSLSTALIEASDDPSTLLSAPTRNCYDVFLSFRGLDTRKGFTDHLYIGLVDAGIHTFKDDNELHHGKEIGPNLFGAIKNSKILIPVLSVNYGSSKWCLDELVQIMECKNNNKDCLVLPIFYKVEPTHVRHQIGNFGEAFHTCGRHFDLMILEKWKQALIKVSSLKGWEGNRYEGELVKLVVQRVLSELKKEFELVIPENLVGIDGHVEKVIKFVDNNYSATLFIGIHGMGGIGKTTLAKAIYNKLSDQFQYHSFIADIRESCQRKGLEYLQNQLISDILKQKNQVSNKDDGTKFISYMFKDKKGTEKIEAIDLSKGNSEGFNTIAERDGGIYTEKQFKNLTSLRFLHIEGAHLNGDFKNSIEGLRWLRWPNCPMNFEVNNFHVKELAVLELSISEINGKWEGWSSFMFIHLRTLSINLCKNLPEVQGLDKLKFLESLTVACCDSIEQLDLPKLEVYYFYGVNKVGADFVNKNGFVAVGVGISLQSHCAFWTSDVWNEEGERIRSFER